MTHRDSLQSWASYAAEVFHRPWGQPELMALANQSIPDDSLGVFGWLVRADMSATWAKWYLEGMIDPAPFIRDHSLAASHMYVAIAARLRKERPHAPIDELRTLAQTVTKFAWQEVEARRHKSRSRFTKREREGLWFSREPDVRCYLCGFSFSESAKNQFLGRHQKITDNRLPLLVDFVRPRGVTAQSMRVEIDHVRPVAGGGENGIENLQLACGWCNSTKNRYSTLYDSSTWASAEICHRSLGTLSVPQPLWVVRIVGVRGRCEHVDGCTATLANSELFLAPRRPNGALNPTNCAVYCGIHDPWRNDRFVGAATLTADLSRSA